MAIDFYFDFISPYSYLASQLIARRYSHLPLVHRPVVFGTILSRRGATGPGEIPSRRRIGLYDALLLAQHHAIPFEGPPTHPFNSIYALRSVCAVEDQPTRARLADRYFRAAWAEGRALDDLATLRACLAEVGVDHDPEVAGTDPRLRRALKEHTEAALAAGAWGVPSFVTEGVLFFGHDRLELLEAFATGKLARVDEAVERMLARPQPGRIT